MTLSGEDLAAIGRVRGLLDALSRDDRRSLERVLALAGEKPSEPVDGTFWLDPEEMDLWIRDDKAAPFGFDLSRWFTTGTDENFSWSEISGIAPRLVELVRRSDAQSRHRVVLMELHGSWEAWHHNACGRQEPLSGCGYHECVHRWGVLLGYGYEKEWEES
jgi:hypothetical protein